MIEIMEGLLVMNLVMINLVFCFIMLNLIISLFCFLWVFFPDWLMDKTSHFSDTISELLRNPILKPIIKSFFIWTSICLVTNLGVYINDFVVAPSIFMPIVSMMGWIWGIIYFLSYIYLFYQISIVKNFSIVSGFSFISVALLIVLFMSIWDGSILLFVLGNLSILMFSFLWIYRGIQQYYRRTLSSLSIVGVAYIISEVVLELSYLSLRWYSTKYCVGEFYIVYLDSSRRTLDDIIKFLILTGAIQYIRYKKGA